MANEYYMVKIFCQKNTGNDELTESIANRQIFYWTFPTQFYSKSFSCNVYKLCSIKDLSASLYSS